MSGEGARLRVEALRMAFGGLVVCRDVSLALDPGDRVALIGPNGAGKTTFVDLVTGVLKPLSGRVRLMGEDVTALSAAARVRRGLVRTFQISRLFGEMSAREAVTLALLARERRAGSLLARAMGSGPVAREAEDILERLGLAGPESARPVRDLAYGRQRLVEMALAVALRPKVLILDEPAAGLPRDEVPLLLRALDTMPPDVPVLMIEHDMDLVFSFARRVVVLAAGQVIAEGAPEEIAADDSVRRAYLGGFAASVRGRAP